MLGGAVGNTYDRFKRGYVVDYLSLKTKNKKLSDITFNLSDLALFAGAVLTVWSSLFGKRDKNDSMYLKKYLTIFKELRYYKPC